MKQFLTLFIALVTAATVTAVPVIKAKKNNVNWNSSSSWDLNRKPQNGDTIIIPVNYTIVLDNSQTLNNVIIRVVGTLELDNGMLILNSTSRIYVYGKILSGGQQNGDKIKIGNVFKFNDSPPITGAFYADNTTGTAPNGFSPLGILPVTFINFNVSKVDNGTRITWTTATEINNNRFEIEKSFDGSNWSVIAMMSASSVTNQKTTYTFTDRKVDASVTYYRIKQIDNDGSATYTAIRSLKNTEVSSSAKIFASSNKTVTIQFDAVRTRVSVRILNLNGQPVVQDSYQNSAYISLNLNNAVSGLYVVQVTDQDNNVENKKIIL